MIAAPPSLVGAVHVTDTEAFPAVPDTFVGVPGVVRGVTGPDMPQFALGPAELTKLTRNVYGVPFVKPVTVALVAVDTPSTKVVQVVPLEEYWIT